jgi:hypothetical protein
LRVTPSPARESFRARRPRRSYAVIIGILLSAARDAEQPPLHAWQHLARVRDGRAGGVSSCVTHARCAPDWHALLPQLSLAPMVRTSAAAGGGSVVLAGGLSIDKRAALLLTSLFDLLATLLIAGGIEYARSDLVRRACC